MAQTVNSTTGSGRELALARRRAMSSKGKAAVKGAPATRTATQATAPATIAAPVRKSGAAATTASVGRAASRARRAAMSSKGKAGVKSSERVRGPNPPHATPQAQAPQAAKERSDSGCGCKTEPDTQARRLKAVAPKPNSRIKPRNNVNQRIASNPTRAAALARRQAQSTRGKAGLNGKSISPAQTARAANPQLSARELAQALRAQRSARGNAGQKKSEPSGRVRPTKPGAPGAAQDAPWKVGAGETGQGQTVTGTMVGRSLKTTGDEPSTCRTITGTQYMGADIFREFCQAEPNKNPLKVRQSSTSHGSRVTGSEVGRSAKVTGDEPGACKRVTGSEYVSADQAETFCGTRPEQGPAKVTRVETRKGKPVTGTNVGRSSKVTGDEPGARRELTGTQYTAPGNGSFPAKVGVSGTLRGGAVTGTMVGRSTKVTGDEPGSCRNITGNDYVGQEQYKGFCSTVPAPQDRKVGASQTFKGETVTGTQTGRSTKVTGDEPGTCKAITGTPYAGAEQYRSYCKPEDTIVSEARTRSQRSTPGSVMTGKQPGIGGRMTGSERGACEPLTGTPYVGADQFAAACPATAAEPASPDFPQALDKTPWNQFSVVAPSHASQSEAAQAAVTGSRYEQGQITGPFGKASGKVTGTEEARFGRGNGGAAAEPLMPPTAETVEGRVKARITGEGMDAGLKITGDDWDRGDRVTGTEGTSAMGRNPTRRGPMSAMADMRAKRNEQVPAPVSKVTGSSGNTDQGSLITYSGGARG